MRTRRMVLAAVAAVVSIVASGVVNVPAASAARPRVLLIGDSTLAALDWYADSQEGLAGLDYVLRAASCRAVTGQSCLGRANASGRRVRPTNALTVLREYPKNSFDELVLMVGYDEGSQVFAQSVSKLPEVARELGIDHITWLTFRTNVDYSAPNDVVTSYHGNNRLLVSAANASDGYIELLDWNWYVRNHSGQVERDGVHLTSAGAFSVAELIRQAVINQWGSDATSSSARRPQATPTPIGSSPPTSATSASARPQLNYGSVGDSVKEAQRLLIKIGSPTLARHGPTGRYFDVTESAVEQFQTMVRETHASTMVVDGVVGPATWRWLDKLAGEGTATPSTATPRAAGSTSTSTSTSSSRIGYGATGVAVTEIQKILLRIGAPLLEPHGATGRYFAATRDSVTHFQQMVRISHDPTMVVDGIVGPATRRWLDTLDPG